MPLPEVELHQAFLWTCDDCGRDNFERAIPTRPPVGIMAWFDAELPDDLEKAGGDWFTAPERVKCPHCGAEFKTEVA